MSAPEPQNLLFILSDQHAASVLGCADHAQVQTPNLDRLAQRGTRFSNAWCASPLCVPSRASIATGRYVHQLEAWDNAKPYAGGEARSWGHVLREHDISVTTVGKLHFRSEQDDTGFADQRLPLHVLGGTGNMIGLLRGDMPPLPHRGKDVLEAGSGASSYIRYDSEIADTACTWLREEASAIGEPWVLHVAFVCPHPPWKVPQQFLDMYDPERIALPVNWQASNLHPELAFKRSRDTPEEPFSEAQVRNAMAVYFALVSFLDAQIGLVLEALEAAGVSERTRVLYTSDHGESLGAHGQWGKCSMLESALSVPLLLAGEGVRAGHVEEAPVSLIDLVPTILQATGVPVDDGLPGNSLFEPLDPDRVVFSEYHATSSTQAAFALRQGSLKYVHYGDGPHVLRDLGRDSAEQINLAGDPVYASVCAQFEATLRGMVGDPMELDAVAKSDQRRRVDAAGGVDAVLARSAGFRGTPAPDLP